MGATFNPFTGTIDFTSAGGGGTGSPGGPDTSVQFNDGGTFGGDSGLTFNKTTNILAFLADGGASFAGAQSPIVMTGGTDPNGNTAIELTNAEGYNAFYSDDEIAISSDTSIEIFTGAGEGELSIIHGAVILQGAATSQLRAGLVDGIFQLAARDVDGAVWSAFATLTSANTPTFVVTPPAGGTVSLTGTTVNFVSYLETAEVSAPSAPAANGLRLFAQDNGAGKTQLMVLFATGAAQQIAVQA